MSARTIDIAGWRRASQPRWRVRARGRVRATGAALLLACVVLAGALPVCAACLPAAGLPGAPREASPVGSVLAGLGVVGPASTIEAALIDAAAGRSAPAGPDCSGGAGSTQTEPANLPAAAPDRGAGNPFDVVTGAKHEHRIDLALPAVDALAAIAPDGRVSPALASVAAADSLLLQFSRFYASANRFSLSLGPGWSHSFDTRLARRRLDATPTTGLPAAELQLLQADGRQIAMRPVVRVAGEAPAIAAGTVSHAEPVRYQGVDPADGVIDEDLADPRRPWVWRWPSGRQLAFDARGRLADIVAPDLERLRLRYDLEGRLEVVEDRHSRTIRLAHSGGRLAELWLPDGSVIRYAYDDARRLVAVRYPDGRLVRHHYEDPERPELLTGTTGPDGRRSRFRYRHDGRVEASHADTADPGGEVRASYRSDDPGGSTGETRLEYRGQMTRYRWRLDPAGIGTITAADGPGCPVCPDVGQTVSRDRRGRPVAVGDWRLEYDRAGRVARLARGADAQAPVWRFEYPGADLLARPFRIDAPSVVPGERRQVLLRYNVRGQTVEIRERGWAPYSDGVRPVARSVRITHAETGVLAGKTLAIEQFEGGSDEPPPAPDGGASHRIPGLSARTELRFDALRRLEAIVYPEGIEHRVERDRVGRPVRERLPDGTTLTREFDAQWQLTRLQVGALALDLGRDRTGRLQSIAFGSGGRWQIEQRSGEIRLSDGERPALRLAPPPGDGPGRAAAEGVPVPGSLPQGLIVVAPALVQIDADGRRTETRFDDLGRVVEERSERRGLRQVFHDSLGHPVRVVLPAGGVELRRFDAAGRLIERDQRTPGATVITRLDWSGLRLVGIDHPEHSIRARHDERGRPEWLEHRLGERVIRINYRYDALGRLSERSLGDGLTLQYQYDASGRPTRLGLLWPGRSEPFWLVDEVVYRHGEAVSEWLAAGVRLARSFDSRGRLVGLDWTLEDGRTPLARFALGRGGDGLLDSIGRLDGEERFGFDAAGRLIVREWQRRGGPTLSTFIHYSPGGDLQLSRDESGGTRRWEQPDADPAGRPLHHGPWRLGYGPSGRIERLERDQAVASRDRPATRAASRDRPGASDPPVRRIDYRYNALGERVLRRIESDGVGPRLTRFLYHQQALVAELGAEGRITRHFIRWQGRVIAIVEPDPAATGRGAHPPRIHWLLGDHLGTPQVAIDSNGRPVWRARYGVYGELIDEHGTFDQPLRLPGQYHDRETGLHDNYQRSYDPRRGRYLEPDPLGLAAGWNLYAYAAGNPVQAADPLGLILFAFDGTGNSDPARAPDTLSNVAKFFSLYTGADRYYMSGVGTLDSASGIGADTLDALSASSARRRVDHMLGVLDSALRSPQTRSTAVSVDVIGFSRGAAMARDFANTVAARIDSGRYLALQRCVTLNFIGLWDTVAQFGLNGEANAQWNLGIPPQARVVVHAVALNERRRYFPLESIGNATAAPAAGWRLERGFIGDHGDIGGSQHQGDLSDVALGWMVEQARKAGLGLKALDVAWQTVSEPLLHDARSFWAPGPDREFRMPALSRGPGSAGAGRAGRPIDELAVGLDRMRAESMIRRYPYLLRGHDGGVKSVGKVDMAAYSAWLSEHYGLEVQY